MCGDENVACKIVDALTVCVDCYLDYIISSIVSDATATANARIAELERQLAQRTGRIFAEHRSVTAILQPVQVTDGDNRLWA